MSSQDDDGKQLSPSIPLTSVQIMEAVGNSSDSGITLFLSKMSLSEIGAKEMTELALAGRHGRQTTVSIVERLALGNNRLTSLPAEFIRLTHLRYLNLRHNSFTTFPDVLTSMPVLDTLDLSYNKLRRLPIYPGNLTRMRILSLSRNKITKLPTYLTQFRVLELFQIDRNPIDWPPLSVLETFGDSRDINNGKEWVRNLQTWMDAEISRNKEFEDSGYSEQVDVSVNSGLVHEPWFPMHDTNTTPHARSFSIDSDESTSSILNNSTGDIETIKRVPPKRQPLNLTTDTKFLSRRFDHAEALSALSYTSSPVSANQPGPLPEPDAIHVRTASHASTLRKPQPPTVPPKKSLPDLRIRDGRKRIPILPEYLSSNAVKSLDDQFSSELRQNSGSYHRSLMSSHDEEIPATPRTAPLLAIERSSYFRRSSNIQSNQSLPQALRFLVLSARGILFALGQLYQALDQHFQHDIVEQPSKTFRKILDPANVTMLHLIRSLDRFDDVGQKTTPSPAVCRALVESCRDAVFVFRKVVGCITSQMAPDLEDIRHSRWLVLELYAVTAELSHAWQSLVSYLEPLRSLLSSNGFLKAPNFGTTVIENPANSIPLPAQTGQLAPPVRLRPVEAAQTVRTRTARRHAGSFSTKDVQIGKELPSYDIIPTVAGGLTLGTQMPTLRTPKRQLTLPIATTSTPTISFNAPSYLGSVSDSVFHQRGRSQSSLLDDIPSPPVFHESPLVTNLHSGGDILRAVQPAIDLAPLVWDQIEEALGEAAVTNQDILESIEQARSATKRLSDDAVIMSEGYSDADTRLLCENAQLFLKTLVHLSNVLKTNGNPLSLPAALRANMVKLTNHAEEVAVLLPFSSVTSYTPHDYSPVSDSQHASHNATSYPLEETQLLAGLSRSRSEQPTLRPRAPLASSHGNGVRRPRQLRETSTCHLEPG